MRQIILKPVLSEKAMAHTALGRYVFYCIPSSNKIEIKQAVEAMFEVKVKAVRTLIEKPARIHRLGSKMRPGHTATRKKAYITLESGYTIELAGLDTTGGE